MTPKQIADQLEAVAATFTDAPEAVAVEAAARAALKSHLATWGATPKSKVIAWTAKRKQLEQAHRATLFALHFGTFVIRVAPTRAALLSAAAKYRKPPRLTAHPLSKAYSDNPRAAPWRWWETKPQGALDDLQRLHS